MRNRKRILYVIGLVLCAALFVVLGKASIKTGKIENKIYSMHPHTDKAKDYVVYQKLTANDVLEQTFTPDTRTDGIVLYMCKEEETRNTGNVKMTLAEADTGIVVYEDLIENRFVADGQPIDIFFYDTTLQVGTTYKITLTGDVQEEDRAVSVNLQGGTFYQGVLKINGEQDTKWALGLGAYKKSRVPSVLFWLFMAAALTALSIVLVVKYVCRLELHWVFLTAALLFGGLYMFLIAPGKGCDSRYHYETAYYYSNVLLCNGKNHTSMAVREEDAAFIARNMNSEDAYFDVMGKDAFSDLKDSLNRTGVQSGDGKTTVYTLSTQENIISYLPLAFGLALGRLLGLNGVICAYLARFLALVCFALMITLAIRIVPVGKTVFAAVGLLPMSLHEYSAFSYDGMCIASVILFTACWLYQNCSGNNKSDAVRTRYDKYVLAIWMISAFLVGASKKGAYLFVILLLVSLGREVLSRRRKLAVCGSMAISLIVCNLTSFLAVAAEAIGLLAFAGDGSKYIPGNSYTLSYAVEHPLQFLIKCVGSLLERLDYYVGSTVGTHLSANTQMMPVAVGAVFWILLLLISCRTEEEKHIWWRGKIACVVVFILTSAVMFFMMQVSTPVGWNIDGVTGRYFLPVLPLIFLCMHANGITVTEGFRSKSAALFYMMHVVEIFYAAWFILSR